MEGEERREGKAAAAGRYATVGARRGWREEEDGGLKEGRRAETAAWKLRRARELGV